MLSLGKKKSDFIFLYEHTSLATVTYTKVENKYLRILTLRDLEFFN